MYFRSSVSLQLINMHDTGSGLDKMTVWCSTMLPGNREENITEPMVLHPHSINTFEPNILLPEGQRIFTNVYLCDHVGMSFIDFITCYSKTIRSPTSSTILLKVLNMKFI